MEVGGLIYELLCWVQIFIESSINQYCNTHLHWNYNFSEFIYKHLIYSNIVI